MSDAFEVRFLPAARQVRVPGGTTLFRAAHWAVVPIDSTCGGLGTCGRCRVLIEEGSAAAIGSLDRHHLSDREIAEGWRLACLLAVDSDMVCVVPEVGEIPRTAMMGEGRDVSLEPALQKIYLELDPPSDGDLRSDLDRLQEGLRGAGLSCSIDLDLMVDLPRVMADSAFRVTAVVVQDRLIAIEPGDTRGELFGIAFDVGTTTVVGALLDLDSGEVLGVQSTLNRQASFGGDVISRIAYTMGDSAAREEMQRAGTETLQRIMESLWTESGISSERVYEILAVGNCTMLHLLLGVEARSIALAPFVPVFSESLSVPARSLGLQIHPGARLETLPVVGAYVGADTVAGLQATDLGRREGLRLFVDIGTNSEIALGSSQGVVTTAAPAGPAFEGSCIRSGMAASEGAIERVRLRSEIELGVVGGGVARGICGSGLIDAAAELLRSGLLNSTGRLATRSECPDHALAEHLIDLEGERAFALAEGVCLTQSDIRELQVAKSSVWTGVRALMERLAVSPEDIVEILLAGSFGSSIDPANARTLGLVPEVPLERIRFVGNAAIEGAKMALMSFRERQVAEDLATRIDYVELSARPDFNDLFLEGLAFPIVAGRGGRMA